MKVYKSLRNFWTTGILCYYKESSKFFEDKGMYYSENGSYPFRREEIEDHPEHFERLPDDEHTKEYYIENKYSEYEFQQALLNAKTS